MGITTFFLGVNNGTYEFDTTINKAIENAELQIAHLNETIESINGLKPECDKLDYALAASSGALCGIIDIFLAGKPGESPIGNVTDTWFKNRTMDFAKLCGWDNNNGDLSSAIRHLEKKFKIPYDQRGMGDAASFVFDLNAKNHHFKSLGHNPTLLGLFFSILDQFTNRSHFISGGELIELEEADDNFSLRGNTVPAKLFCGFVNWFGHLISDMSGSSGSKGRGMGIPSPFWAWTNDIIAIKSSLNIPISEFDKNISEMAVKIYNEEFDLRFQATQLIPIFLNELIVRLTYSIRRMLKYFKIQPKEDRSFKLLWESCEPFSNPTVKIMLTVAHGTFCLVDIGDATIRGIITSGGSFNATEFVMRLNVAGIGRLAISLYGEGQRAINYHNKKVESKFAQREKIVIDNYIAGLKELSIIYDDKELILFIANLHNSNAYLEAFQQSVLLAKKRGVEEDKILKNKADIDAFFKPQGGN